MNFVEEGLFRRVTLECVGLRVPLIHLIEIQIKT